MQAVLGAIASPAEYENHGMLTLQFRELAAFGSMVSKFVVGKERPGHDIGSHNGRSFRCVATCFSDVSVAEDRIPDMPIDLLLISILHFW